MDKRVARASYYLIIYNKVDPSKEFILTARVAQFAAVADPNPVA